ncbi:MAG: hypothetical protein HN576_00815 [Bacteriovoracaceae bacterium]|jgi:hypothetical protein|nr:hypothetical protein [Bacteriovoracaceae bacterium]
MKLIPTVLLFCLSINIYAAEFLAGASKVEITPKDWERRPVDPKNPLHGRKAPWYDSGIDNLFDHEEPGALGLDKKPGIAGIDDDGNGLVDDCTRLSCDEYAAKNSDDIRDPNKDNFHKKRNKKGTEKDGKYQFAMIAGFAPYYPIKMIPRRTAADVHDPLWSRAIAVKGSNNVPLIMITTDLPGLTWKYINPVKRRLAKDLNIPFNNIIITSTHNHYGPDASGFWVTLMKGHNKHYTDKLKQWIYQSGVEAYKNMKPAQMKTVTSEPYSCFDRKTLEIKRSSECNIASLKKDQENPRYDAMLLQTDYRDPIVRNTKIVSSQFVDLLDGKTIATFINWHNHPDTMGEKQVSFSSGYSHYIRDFVEAKMGGIAAYFVGTLGCQIQGKVHAPKWTSTMQRVLSKEVVDSRGKPVPQIEKNPNKFHHIRNIGYEIGNEVVTSLKSLEKFEAITNVQIKTDIIDNEVDNFLQVLTTGTVWKFDVEKPDKMKHYFYRCLGRHGCVRSHVSVVQLGDLSLITGPGEIDPAYFTGRKEVVGHYDKKPKKIVFPAMKGAREFMKGPHKAVLGQANNYLSYLIPKSDNVGWFRFNHPIHYEEFVTIGKEFGDDVGNKWMQMLGSKHRYSDREIYPTQKRLLREQNNKTFNLESIQSLASEKQNKLLFNKLIYGLLKKINKEDKIEYKK